MPSKFELGGRLIAALVLGGAIGFEREVTGQVAGLRTHMCVALGAALFAIVSAFGFEEFVQARAGTNLQVDVSRVASNIVTGIGFLGGGAIIKEGASVKGLTTAASLWVTAAVGSAVAMGEYFVAAVCTLALILSLTMLRGPRVWLRNRFVEVDEGVVIRLRSPEDAGEVIKALRGIDDIDVSSVALKGGDEEVVVQVQMRGRNVEVRLAELAERDDVVDVILAS
ncbi:MAG: MgtC/SapB family protein [Acidimicrobiia bacterium]